MDNINWTGEFLKQKCFKKDLYFAFFVLFIKKKKNFLYPWKWIETKIIITKVFIIENAKIRWAINRKDNIINILISLLYPKITLYMYIFPLFPGGA